MAFALLTRHNFYLFLDSSEVEWLTFLGSGDFCCLLITLTNILDPDQDRHDVSPDLDPKHLTL